MQNINTVKRKKEICDADKIMNAFMKRLANNELKKETEPYTEGANLTEEFIEKKLASYTKLLESDFMDNVNQELDKKPLQKIR